jgi:hypothetical protein
LIVEPCGVVDMVLRFERGRFLGLHGCNHASGLGIREVEPEGGRNQQEERE